MSIEQDYTVKRVDRKLHCEKSRRHFFRVFTPNHWVASNDNIKEQMFIEENKKSYVPGERKIDV